MASVLSRIQIIMEANTANYNNELRRARENSSKTFKGIAKSAGVMALGAGVALAGVGVSAVKVAGNFEEAMNGVRSVSGATGEDFTKLRDLAKELGSETSFSATQAANGMEELAKAGFTTEQILATLPSVLALASAGSIELAQSAGIVGDVLGGMSLSAEHSVRVADVLAKAASSSATDVAALGEAMSNVAPVAATMGQDLETTTALIGALGDKAIASGQAGTQLKGVMLNILENKDGLAELGVTVSDSNGEIRSMIDILKDLGEATKNLSPEEKIAVYQDLFGKINLAAGAALVDKAVDGSLESLKEKLDGAKGSAQEMAAIRMEGLNGAFKTLASAWEGFQIQLADVGLLDGSAKAVTLIATSIQNVTKAMPEMVAKFKQFTDNINLVENLKAAFDNIVGAIKAVGSAIEPVVNWFREHDKFTRALAISIGLVATGFAVYTGIVWLAAAAMTAFATVMAIATAPITAIVIALVAVTAAGVYLYQNWDTIKAKGVEVWQGLKDTISGFVDSVVQRFSDFFNSASNIFTSIGNFISNTWQSVKDKALEVFNSMPEPVKEMAANILSVFTLVKNVVTDIFNFISGVATGAADLTKAAWAVISEVFSNSVDGIKTEFSKVSSFVSDAFNVISEVAASVLATASGYLEALGAYYTAIFDVMKVVASGVLDTIVGIFKANFEAIKAVAVAALTVIASIFNTGFDLIKNAIKTAMNVVKAVMRGDMQGVVDAIRTGLSNAIGIVKTGVDNIITAFKTLGTKLVQIGSDAITGFINGMKGKIGEAVAVVTNLVDKVKNAFTRTKGLDIHSPSRVTKEYGKNTGDGFIIGLSSTISAAVAVADLMVSSIKNSFDVMKNYVLIEKDFNLNKAIFEANKSVVGSIQSLRKEIVLFGNDSRIAAFEYEVAMGSLKHATKEYLDEYRKGLEELDRLDNQKVLNDTATASLKKRTEAAKAYGIEQINSFLSLSESLLTEDEKRVKTLKTQLALIEAMAEATEASVMASKLLADHSAVSKYQSVYDTDTRSTAEANRDTIRDSNVNSEMEYSKQLANLQSLEQTKEVQQAITDLEANQTEKRLQIARDSVEAEKALYAEKLDFVGQTFGTMTDLVRGFTGENSRASKAMFAIEKAHTLASIMLKSKEAIAQAWASAPFPNNLGAVAMATLKTGVIQSAANAIKPSGQAHDGLANVPKEGTYILDKNERVVRPSDNNKLTKFLDKTDKGVGNNITTHVTITGNNASVESNNAMGKELGNAINAAIQKTLRTELRQGGMLAR